MAIPKKVTTILFDLDNTLFDHQNSLHHGIHGIHAILTTHPQRTQLSNHALSSLLQIYNTSLQKAYDAYLSKEITYIEKDSEKVKFFFEALNLPEPSGSGILLFNRIYKEAYRKNRRAMPGSVLTLMRLRERGFRVGIVTNGQKEDQCVKAEAIGVGELVDGIYTSEEFGVAKPDARVFEFALKELGGCAAARAYMVGDSVEADIQGALNAGLHPILFDPQSKETERGLFGKQVPVIQNMSELLGLLGT